MATRTDTPITELIDLLWAIVLIQGAMAVVLSITAVVAFAFSGPAVAVPAVLTITATVATLLTARGLRHRRRWARRVTLFSEWGLLGLATLDAVLTLALAKTLPGLVSLIVGFVVPVVVLRLLRRTKAAYRTPEQSPIEQAITDRVPVLDALV
jgi:hypothetical protein